LPRLVDLDYAFGVSFFRVSSYNEKLDKEKISKGIWKTFFFHFPPLGGASAHSNIIHISFKGTQHSVINGVASFIYFFLIFLFSFSSCVYVYYAFDKKLVVFLLIRKCKKII
jgi:hypothetical protein